MEDIVFFALLERIHNQKSKTDLTGEKGELIDQQKFFNKGNQWINKAMVVTFFLWNFTPKQLVKFKRNYSKFKQIWAQI